MATSTPTFPPKPPLIFDGPPLLSIETEVTLPQFIVDGRPYGLKRRQDLTLREDARVTHWVLRLLALDALPFDEAVADEIATIREQVCRVVIVGMSEAEHQALTDDHRGVIVSTFCLLRWRTLIEAAAGATDDRPTSENASPVSPVSTEDPGTHG
jgi:hypothetical protein